MAKVKVLIEGYQKKYKKTRVKACSTVTLIKSRKNIIVDTGSFLEKDILIRELEKEGLTPQDIDAVILTHLDLDHTANTYLFKNAKVFLKSKGGEYPGETHFPSEGRVERTDLLKKNLIDEDIEIMLMPGYSEDMISVVVRTTQGKVVISGDAFPSKEWIDFRIQHNTHVADNNTFDKNRKKILELADYIIPGHGGIFKVE
jgi:glyoxylase-like metal-dependent hydrolase (beta-lactamase superfamily II)